MRVGNIVLCGDNANYEGANFWRFQYDYLFSVYTAHYLSKQGGIGWKDYTLNSIIRLMRKCLTEEGKGYIVVPVCTSLGTYHGHERNNYNYFTERGLEIITHIPDITNVHGHIDDEAECAAIQFGK